MSDTKKDKGKPALHGWIILDKPRGLGSTQAVAAVKRNLREGGYAKTKVGHGGTLDPEAEGVLPIALGEATKLAGRMLDASKIYEFTIQFGEETDTLDAEGEVVERSSRRPPIAAIAAVLEHFNGEIEQVPPAYSALKVDGKRAYDRARAGEAVEMKTRRVTIHSLTFTVRPEPVEGPSCTYGDGAEEKGGVSTSSARTDAGLVSTFQTTAGRPDPYDVAVPLEMAEAVTLTAHVSKGTYIRSLARDIARALGTVGHVAYLRRIKAGPFREEQAISLDKLNEIGKGAPLQDLLLPLEAGLDDIPALQLDSVSAQAVRQGRVVTEMPNTDGLYLAKLENVPVALVELSGGTMKVVRGFNLPDVAE
ncbi:MAG: tRNA pseudouridine(55) synthase TruB [Sphingomonadaceae bacterium]|nr:tRNA pseudouridine(55) synthase TruB [Sphingomonadaceae bacterium]MCB2085780.1 tRNA pseudouridine(55) synthase TruB [Sphingomonadaceae bacterium]MCP5383272.1 tRNA pseudouridine(55) synthase TruB [Altererythrobacter sp.]MCP5393449.1 tRNA pseudouridine(55) synthase TruB [Sphingomonadaceae bacterium]